MYIVKRIFKYNINENHNLFNYCNNITFKSKNLYNYANFIIRQCFVLYNRDNLTQDQQLFINDINNAIILFNQKSQINFDTKKPKKLLKLQEKLFLLKEQLNTKDNKLKEKIIKKIEQCEKKVSNLEYIPQKYISKENGLLSYDFINYYFCDYLHVEDNPYKLLPAQTSQQILRLLFKNWTSFFNSIQDYKINTQKYNGQPKIPKYKKKDGRSITIFSGQNLSIKNNILTFPKTKDKLNLDININKINEVKIIPNGSIYTVLVVYEKELNIKKDNIKNNRIISIDLGINNFATITNNIGQQPIIINGKILKSINEYYNKKKSYYERQLPIKIIQTKEGKKKIQQKLSKRINKLTLKRNNKIDDFMHKSSRFIINYCIENSIDTIIIGKTVGWKSNINIGKSNNRNFVNIPFTSFIQKLQYKAEENNINVILQEESYTSKSSFLDLDILPIYKQKDNNIYIFSGKRIKRGLYKTENIIINSDVNGSYNIFRKSLPQIFSKNTIKEYKYNNPIKINILRSVTNVTV